MGVILNVRNVEGDGRYCVLLQDEVGPLREVGGATFTVLDERSGRKLAIPAQRVRPADDALLSAYNSKPFRGDLAPQEVHKRRLLVQATRLS